MIYEKFYFYCGLVACFCTGMAWPICGVLFALMLSAMSILDFDLARTWTGKKYMHSTFTFSVLCSHYLSYISYLILSQSG